MAAWWARLMWWRFVPTPRVAAWLAASALLWLLPGRIGVWAGSGAALVIVAGLLAECIRLPSRAGIAVERELPASLGVGDTATLTYRISNFTSHALRVRVGDLLPPLVAREPRDPVALVAPAQGASIALGVTGEARGRALLGPIAWRASTRLGWLEARDHIVPDDTIRVVPSVSGVRRFRLLAIQHRLSTVGVRQLRPKGEGRGFTGLREYAPGDDPRTIDWKATGKRAKYIVREYAIERSQSVCLMIDAGRSMTQLADRYTRFEQALSAALVLTDVAAAAGDRVGAMAFDDEVRAFVPAERGRGALASIRDALTPVEASSTEPDYAGAFRFLATHQRKRALVVLFTDVLDPRASQALIAHVGRGALRHLVLVVALRNEAIVDAARPRREGGVAAAFETAAAEELLASREEALERMRRTGAVVLDVSPHQMTAAVINRYLELKSRGAV